MNGLKNWHAFILLTLLVGVAYANSLPNGFAFDDSLLVEYNSLIRSLDQIPTLLTTEYWHGRRSEYDSQDTSLYRPLVMITYALNYAAGEGNPFGYHLVNVLLHLLVTWLLYRVAVDLGWSMAGSVVAAALFAVHPIHTEVVSGIVGRAELMMAAGVLGGLWMAIRGRHLPALAAFAGGVLSKEQAAMLPCVVVLYDLCRTGPMGLRTRLAQEKFSLFKRAGSRYGPYLLVLAGYLAVRHAILGSLTQPVIAFLDNPIADAGWSIRILTALKVAGFYLWLFLWPSTLSPDYSYNAIPAATSPIAPGVMPAMIAWVTLIALSIWAWLRGDRRITFAIGFMLVMFLPSSNLLFPIGTIMGERLFYLPSAGLCLLVGLGWEKLPMKARYLAIGLLALLCLSLTIRTIARNPAWKNTEVLFRSAVQVVPESAKTWAYLGKVALNDGELEEASRHYKRALAIYPDYVLTDRKINSQLGALFIKKGEFDKALEVLERAVALDPYDRNAQYNIGLAYAKLGRLDEAELAYQKALILAPKTPDIHNGLSYVLRRKGKYEQALHEANLALEERPEFLEALYNRARALEALNRIPEALEAYNHVLELKPTLKGVKQKILNLQEKLASHSKNHRR